MAIITIQHRLLLLPLLHLKRSIGATRPLASLSEMANRNDEHDNVFEGIGNGTF
jgi:hypothetical protein